MSGTSPRVPSTTSTEAESPVTPPLTIGPGLQSALAGRPRLPGQPVKTIPRPDVIPVAIRSGGPKVSLSSSQDAKHAPLSKFTPNIHAVAQQQGFSVRGALRPKGESVMDIGAMLAHSLSYKNMRSGVPTTDLHLQRQQAGPLGAAARGNRRQQQQGPATVQAKVQQHLNTIRRKKGKKSRDVMELSWAEGPGDVAIYTPITLPYVAKATDDDGSGDTPTTTTTRRPTVQHIDESNRNAASLFRREETDALDDLDHQWYLVQFPEILPALLRDHSPSSCSSKGPSTSDAHHHPSPSTSSAMHDPSDRSYCPSRLNGLPEGRLGTLDIHQSGRVVFRMGDHSFEVNQGSDCNFAQEVACLVGGNAELMFLGRCQKRIVVTPDINHYMGT